MAKRKQIKQVPWIIKIIFTGIIFSIIGLIVTSVYQNIKILHDTDETNTSVTNTYNLSFQEQLQSTELSIKKANVYIKVSFNDGFEEGSGTIISQDNHYYYILTNYHVIDGNNNIITIKKAVTYDGIPSDYDVLATDATQDLALLRIVKGNREDITPLSLSTNSIIDNEVVIAIGNPLDNESIITIGKFIQETTLKELEITHQAIEHDAVLFNGCSGGALVDIQGDLLGINTWELNGKYYAIPSSVLNTFLENNL